MSEEVKVKISQPMFEVGELERFDNNIHSIVEEYSKLFFKEKEQILIQRIIMKQEEIERLNNIINELEKWLEMEIKRIEELQNPAKSKVKPYGEEYNYYTLIIGAYDNALDKLQELKGSYNNG